ncbi:hypothetical protein JEQ12_003905 [Ovis aries]|uniref:C-type lectin domain-containing protein n=1 Tax=Ovis aries TaxID=9940 RepID=A0A836CXB3_SHEEP|nr:hypothetical protein JEQ12_003905 [Ovis aries]
MPVMGLRLSLCTAALQLTSEGKTFWRVAEELSWSEALEYCRRHHTDLADLHSMSGWSSIKALYSLTSSHEAWIGLFFDVRLGGLRWSGGSSFSASVWGSLPTFREGLCATLYSITFLPSLGAAWCSARKPFICYYDPTVGSHTLLEPVLSLTATPKPAVTSERSGTNMTGIAPATQAQHWSSANHPESKEKTPAPKPGQLFGILKADFLIPVLMDPEDMKDQFLSEALEMKNKVKFRRTITGHGRSGPEKANSDQLNDKCKQPSYSSTMTSFYHTSLTTDCPGAQQNLGNSAWNTF